MEPKLNPTRKLPIFKAFIDDETTLIDGEEIKTGLNAVGFVDQPATDMMWMAFNEHKPMSFKVTNKEKRIVSGWAMVADMPIYRNDNGMEFYVQFGAEDIFKIGKLFFKNGLIKSVNLMHDQNMYVQDIYVIESIFTDDRGITVPEEFGKAPSGSWFLSFAVDNIEVWDEWIKSGKIQGFSVEGIFKHAKLKDEKANKLEDLHNRIAELRKKIAENVTK